MRIVVVEDEASIRNGLANMLPKINPGYEVVGVASDGEEGLEIVSRTRPDLVIMDIQMPGMDGLTMLAKLRKKSVQCKVLVLTAYSDFSYAKRAIELNIENYLLKPIKIPELKRTLDSIDAMLNEEKRQEMIQEHLLSLEQIFRAAFLAELPIDDALNKVTMEKYGVDVGESLTLFSIWLGEKHSACSAEVVKVMETCTGRADDYKSVIMTSSRYQIVMTILYHVKHAERVRRRYGTSVVPVICRDLPFVPIFTWMECNGMKELPDALAELMKLREWNLNFAAGTLISPQLIRETVTVPLKYPIGLETELRQAILKNDKNACQQIFRRFIDACMKEPHNPEEICEACVRYCIHIYSLVKTMGRMKDGISAQLMVGKITQAVSWEEIDEILEGLYMMILADDEEDADLSPLVKQARKMIEEYYSHGITLEELAQKLCVSEEYLSSQFKKETGASFTETIRKYRIDKVKELLLHSNLKLNQIADMVGYSDPKYMSKVFRDEVGMLPAQFRKVNS